MSVGQAIGGIAGGIIGAMVPGVGWVIGAQIGMLAGGYIDPPKGPDLVGPRLSDTSVQVSTYGAVLPRVYGNMKLAGNIVWIENNALKEVKTEEKVGGKGGSSAKKITYTYYATFFLALTDGEFSAVRRIWFADKLVYDAGVYAGESVESMRSRLIASASLGDQITVFYGSSDQSPSARMQMTLGAANTPAYRGIGGILFEDIDLTDYGNSLLGLQVKVELVKTASATAVELAGQDFVQVSIPYGGEKEVPVNAVIYGAENSVIAAAYIDDWYGVVWGTRFFYHEHGVRSYSSYVAHNLGYYGGGTSAAVPIRAFSRDPVACYLWATSGGFYRYKVVSVTPDGTVNWTDPTHGGESSGFAFADLGMPDAPSALLYSPDAWSLLLFSWQTGYKMARVDITGAVETVSSADIRAGCADYLNGKIYCAFMPTGSATVTLTIIDAVTLAVEETWSVTAPDASSGSPADNTAIHVTSADLFHVLAHSNILEFSNDGTTWHMRAVASGVAANAGMPNVVQALGNDIFVLGKSGTTSDYAFYLRHPAGVTDTYPLAEVVRAECLQASQLSAGDLDTTTLTQGVFGAEVASIAAIRAGLEPLRAAYPFDIVQDGYKIRFTPRGGASVATISADDLGAGRPDQRLTIAREQAAQLPSRVEVVYKDLAREYDQNVQLAERQNAESAHVRRVELPIALDSTQAAGVAETLLRLNWLERNVVTFSLPPTFAHLQPGDVVTVNYEGSHELRLIALEYLPDGVIEVQARYNKASIYTPAAEGASGPAFVGGLGISGSSEAVLIDGPAIVSAYDTPGFAVAIHGFTEQWPGGVLERTDDAGINWIRCAVVSPPGAAIFTADDALANAVTTTMFDESATLTVRGDGEIDSVTTDEVLAGANLFAIGADGRWEIVGAATATLNGDGSYTLSRLLRGRFGTEWATGTHQADDYVIPVSTTGKVFVEVDTNLINTARTYRATTVGKYQSQVDIPFTYTAANLKPYAPVYLNGARNAANDWALTWTRRTRIGGEWRDGVDAPLSESVEAYEVEIWDSGYATLKRTLAGLSSATASYTSAQQVSDFGSNQTTLYVRVYQLSATAGRGYALQQSITRT